MTHFIQDNPTLVAVAITIIMIAIIAWNDPHEKKAIEKRKSNGVPPIYFETYELVSAIENVTSEAQLLNLRMGIDRFIVLYQHDSRYQETMDEIMDAYNQKRDELHDVEHLLTITPTFVRNAKKN